MTSAPGPETVAVPPRAPAAHGGLFRSLALTASFWALAGEGGTYIVRLGSNLVLTRLIDREAFGIMVLLTVCIVALQMFSDLGFRTIIVQHPRGDDPDFMDTAWTMQVIRGVLLALGGGLLAWPLARIYDQPEILRMLPVLSLTAVIDALAPTKVYTCDRHLAQGRISVILLTTAVFSSLVVIACARWWPGVWALIAGTLAGAVMRTVLSHRALPGRANRFRWDTGAYREMLRFGKWVSVSSVFTFLAMQADRLIFAKMIPFAELGVYGIGTMVARLPVELLMKMANSVGLPLLSRSHGDAAQFQRAFRRFRLPFLAAGGAALGGLVLGGPALIRLLYDNRYADAGWIIQIVSVAAWFQVLECSNAVALLAAGQPKWLAAGTLTKVVLMAAALPAGYHAWGFPGALVALSVIEIPRYLVVASAARRAGAKGWTIEVVLTAALLASVGFAVALHSARAAIGSPGRGVAAAAAGFAVLWLPMLAVAVRKWRAAT